MKTICHIYVVYITTWSIEQAIHLKLQNQGLVDKIFPLIVWSMVIWFRLKTSIVICVMATLLACSTETSCNLTNQEAIRSSAISSNVTAACQTAKQHLGLLYCKLHQSSPHVWHQMCHSAILHILNYCSAVCDAHHVSGVSFLEGVQKFAGRIITKNWKSLHPQLEPCSSQRKL